MKLNEYLDKQGHGSGKALGGKIDARPQLISRWRNGVQIPLDKLVKMYYETKGAISLHENRPDVFHQGAILSLPDEEEEKED